MSRRRKSLVLAGIVLVVAILIPVIHHYQLRFEVDSYIARLKGEGEPTELAQVVPPPVPREQNGVPLVMNALTNLESKYNSISETNPPPAMREISPGKAMVGWQQSAIIGFNENAWPLTNNLMTNTWADLGKELAAAKSDLTSLQSLTNHPILDFNLDYETGYSIRLQHLVRLKQAAQWLRAAVLYDLHERKTAEACTDVHAILALAKGQTEEPLEISQLVRSAIASIGVDTTWETLHDPNVSESDLASLQRDWESIEFLGAAQKAFLAERVIDLHSMEHLLQSPSDLWRGVSGNPKAISWKACKFLWRWFWAYADEKRMMQTYQVLADAMRFAETNRSFQSEQWFVRTNFNRLGFEMPFPQEGTFRVDVDPFGTRWLMSEDAFDSFILLRRSMVFQTVRNMTIVAIALKRYELQYHHLPATLDELVPEFLKSVPTDYMDGQPLHYRRNADGTFLLYSVGKNGKDDGGNPALEKGAASSDYYWLNPQALDWVWPQPATPQEIHAYYTRHKSEN